jgi:hypothetical protein
VPCQRKKRKKEEEENKVQDKPRGAVKADADMGG